MFVNCNNAVGKIDFLFLIRYPRKGTCFLLKSSLVVLWSFQQVTYFMMVQDDGQQRKSTQGEVSPHMADDNDDEDDQSMQSEEDDAGKAKGKTITSRQNERLYTAEGILNPKMKKAEKKRRKKANKLTQVDAVNDDYDFKVDYVKRGSAMDVSDEE